VPAVAAYVAVVVGLPVAIRQRIEQRFKGRVVIRSIPLRRDGGFALGCSETFAKEQLEQYADLAPHFDQVLVVLLPYARIVKEVSDVADTLETLGARVCRARPGVQPWPSRPPRLDQQFLDQLESAISSEIDAAFPPRAVADPDADIAFELLRGLIRHSKMGPNSHSHEDDLWKARGRNLGPGGRERIVDRLLGEGVLNRKKNISAGGTGWVYWVEDVQLAKELYPKLEPYLGEIK
jgi:hypothetical protein